MAKQIGFIGYKILIDVDEHTTADDLKAMIRSAAERVLDNFMADEFGWDEYLSKLKQLPESTFTGEGIYISAPLHS